MKIDHEKKGNTTVVSIEGEITLDTREQLKTAIEDLGGKDTKLIVDLSKVSYIDSSGLGLLVDEHKAYRDSGGRLALCSANDNLLKLFEITRLNSLFDSYDNAETALGAIGED